MKRTSFEPLHDKYGLILTINEENSPGWYDTLLKNRENIYSTHAVLYAFHGMPTYIYLTNFKGIVGRAIVGSDEDFKRIKEKNIYTNKQVEKGTPLIKFVARDVINMYDLIGLGIFKKVPIVSKYISKNDFETIESLF